MGSQGAQLRRAGARGDGGHADAINPFSQQISNTEGPLPNRTHFVPFLVSKRRHVDRNAVLAFDTMENPEVERWSPLKVCFYSLLHRSPKSNVGVVEYANLSAADRFLDVGCGPGAALEHALRQGAVVAGVDPSASMVARAAKRVPDAQVKVGSAESIPFPDDTFTIVINVSSFHHWADREAGLREIRRVLAPGGHLHIVEGKLREGQDGHGLNTQDARVLEKKLGELGYTSQDVDTIKPGWRHEYLIVSATKLLTPEEPAGP